MHMTKSSNLRLVLVIGITACLALVGFGCSDDDIPGVDTTNYYGISADPSGTPGTIALQGTLFSPATGGQTLGGGGSGVSLEGTFTYGGTPISVDGFYDTGTGVFAFEDTTGNYSFNGTVAGIVVSGYFFGPNGTGSFVMWSGTTAASVTTFCGTGTCSSGCSGSAAISLAHNGTSAILAASVDDGPIFATGTVSGASVHFDVTSTNPPLDGNIDGVIAGASVTGSFDETNNGWIGTWTANTGNCTLP